MLILDGVFTFGVFVIAAVMLYGFIKIANGCDSYDDETDKELHDL